MMPLSYESFNFRAVLYDTPIDQEIRHCSLTTNSCDSLCLLINITHIKRIMT